MEAIRPAVVVVSNNVCADAGPFGEIGGWVDTIGLDAELVLDGDAEAVDDIATRLVERGEIGIRESKIVGCGIVFIGVEVAEDVWDIDEAETTVCAACVVEADIGDARLFDIGLSRYGHEYIDILRKQNITTIQRKDQPKAKAQS